MEVPCFRCLFMENLKARACNPGDCKRLEQWLFSETGLKPETLSKASC
jgi:hypothetical protein